MFTEAIKKLKCKFMGGVETYTPVQSEFAPLSEPVIQFTSHKRKIADQLAEHLCLQVTERLGAGLQGEAFLMNSGQVLKITDDDSEYFICTSLINKNVKHIYKIYSTYRLMVNGEEYFGILEERLDTSEQESMHQFELDSVFRSRCLQFIKGFKSLDELLLDSASAKERHPHYSFYIDQYLNMSLASKEVGVFNSDMHSGNIGRKGDHLVAFDLGFSETVSRTEGISVTLFI